MLEILQNKIELLVSKISGTILYVCMPLLHRFLNLLGLHNLRISSQVYRLCSQRAVSRPVSQMLPNCTAQQIYFKSLGEGGNGTKGNEEGGKNLTMNLPKLLP